MDAPIDHRRMRLVALVAFASVASCAGLIGLSSSDAEAGGNQLRPDLVTLPIEKHDLVLEKVVKRKLLRLSNEVANRGTGPLEVTSADPTPGSCEGDERDAVQLTYLESNGEEGFQREGSDPDDTFDSNRFGCMEFHAAPGHDHWHVLDFAKYELLREHKGTRAFSRKVGFCVIDSNAAFPSLLGAPTERYYAGGCGGPGVEPTEEGLSVGWADIYFFGLPGQSLKLNGLHKGRYCLRSTADPTNLIAEANESNNATELRLKLRPRKLRARPLAGACKL